MDWSGEDLDTLARTIYGEARGESWKGKCAVGWVARQRAEHPGWWGVDVATVCRHPFQFSCWNATDPNRALLERLALDKDVALRECLAAAAAVLAGLEPDPTGGADHYLNIASLSRPPAWYAPHKVTAVLGRHTFLKLRTEGA